MEKQGEKAGDKSVWNSIEAYYYDFFAGGALNESEIRFWFKPVDFLDWILCFLLLSKADIFQDLVLYLKENQLEIFVSDVQNPQNFHLRRCFAFTFRPNMYNFRLDKIWVILPCDYAYTSWFLRFQKSIRHTRPLATLDHLGSKFRLSLHSTGRV